MIPKVIHYCWFGGNPLPKELQDYIDTWKEKCPNYEIKCWNESNYDYIILTVEISRYLKAIGYF